MHPKRLRGGWDCTPDEYKSMGFIIGLPPGMYVPPTKSILDLSLKFEHTDQDFSGFESNYLTQDRQALFDSETGIKCYIRNLPPDCTESNLIAFLNSKSNSQSDVVRKIIFNQERHFAFVYFDQIKTADYFLNYKGQFEISGNIIQIQKANVDDNEDDIYGTNQNYEDAFIVYNLMEMLNENLIREIVVSGANNKRLIKAS